MKAIIDYCMKTVLLMTKGGTLKSGNVRGDIYKTMLADFQELCDGTSRNFVTAILGYGTVYDIKIELLLTL